VEIDWRAHLHPSACLQTSTGASSAAKDCSPENDLTAARDPDPPHDGRSNRRSFTDEEKLAVVLESEQPGMSVAEVCRRHRIVTSMVFRWRVQFGFTGKKAVKLATVTLPGGSSGGSSGPAVLHDLLHPPDGMMPVQLPRWATRLCARRQRSGSGSPACSRPGGRTMMIVPAGVKVHLALGYTDMRKA
jgi:transposase-like protein